MGRSHRQEELAPHPRSVPSRMLRVERMGTLRSSRCQSGNAEFVYRVGRTRRSAITPTATNPMPTS